MKILCLAIMLGLFGNVTADPNGSSAVERTKRSYEYIIPLGNKCYRPCKCDGSVKKQTCPEGVSLIKDGCGCCYMCARQQGRKCDEEFRCDTGLQCNMKTRRCEASDHCTYKGKRLEIGEEISVNCGKNCTCRPSSKVVCNDICRKIRKQKKPLPGCLHPWYKKDSSSCCGKWVCEDVKHAKRNTMRRKKCQTLISEWTSCSKAKCGGGVSRRFEVGPHTGCEETFPERLCKIRTCAMAKLKEEEYERCEMEVVKRDYLRAGSLRSLKKYKVKFCNVCPYLDCQPSRTTTIVVPFRRRRRVRSKSDTGKVVRKNVMKILSCDCRYNGDDAAFVVNRFPLSED